MWDEMIKKVVNIEAKVGLQLSSGTRKIDSKCAKVYGPFVKKVKENAYWEHYNKAFNRNKEKTKSHNPSSSANQPPTQASNSMKYQKSLRKGY